MNTTQTPVDTNAASIAARQYVEPIKEADTPYLREEISSLSRRMGEPSYDGQQRTLMAFAIQYIAEILVSRAREGWSV